mmetsp:Transcript_34385/g.76376  ORF Transcript_34385/g.76376 Transcript_34385/m.76376 type:complete len:374 (+) Transcript_34385:181-1302(+)
MFEFLNCFCVYLKDKGQRKITLVILGIDNAGKTTLLNTIQGELDKAVGPTYGFSSQTLTEGKYKVEVFDLGGGKNIRGIWDTYFAEVHGIMYVVDAADPSRFEESRAALEKALADNYMQDKPIVVFANKQDLPTAAAAAEVATSLGLASLKHNRFNILPCTAKTPAGQQPDVRLREGLKWLISQVDAVFSTLDVRVQQEGDAKKAADAKAVKERMAAAVKRREERERQEREAEEAAALALAQNNALATLPNQIESPGKMPHTLPSSGASHASAVLRTEFSDLTRPDQGSQSKLSPLVHGISAPTPASVPAPLAAPQSSTLPGIKSSLPPISLRQSTETSVPDGVRTFSISGNNKVMPELKAASSSISMPIDAN